MKTPEWICCFCHQEIRVDFTDPCFLNLTTNQDREEVQELTAHADCLNKVLHPDFSLLTRT